jgi:hypothetical protein
MGACIRICISGVAALVRGVAHGLDAQGLQPGMHRGCGQGCTGAAARYIVGVVSTWPGRSAKSMSRNCFSTCAREAGLGVAAIACRRGRGSGPGLRQGATAGAAGVGVGLGLGAGLLSWG